jgi:hypothetical protein
MSYVETHIGRILELSFPDNINDYLINNGININNKEQHKNYVVYYDSDNQMRYIVTESKRLFIVDNTELPNQNDINEFVKINNNEYHYVFKFYNGGTYFDEILTEHLNKIKF